MYAHIFIYPNAETGIMENVAEINLSYTWLVLDSIKKMRDAEASGDLDRFSIYFNFCLRLVIPYMDITLKKNVDDDINLLNQYTTLIRENEPNEETRKKKIKEARAEFANTHMGYVMGTLSKIGLIKVGQDGVIDFTKTDIEQLKQIIRSNEGLERAITKGVEDAKTRMEGK